MVSSSIDRPGLDLAAAWRRHGGAASALVKGEGEPAALQLAVLALAFAPELVVTVGAAAERAAQAIGVRFRVVPAPEPLDGDPAGAGRVLVAYDVHDAGALEDLLAGLLPALGDRENAVVVLGVDDARFGRRDPAYFDSADRRTYWQGELFSTSPALVELYDFLSRNRIAFTTAAESLRTLGADERYPLGEGGSLWFSVGRDVTYPSVAQPAAPALRAFQPWEGTVQPGWLVNWVGARTRTSFQADTRGYEAPTFERTAYPPVSDEYFEWIDVLESVLEARGGFTMVELGAGYGRWLVNAAVALGQVAPERRVLLVGVEGEPTHYRWLRRHLRDNGLDPREHRLIRAAVSARDGWVRFQRGDASGWYGQAITRSDPSARLAGPVSRLIRWTRNTAANRLAFGSSARKVRWTRSVSLSTVLEPLDRVDLVHVDVQGAEAEVLEAGREHLAVKVRRVHVGTHDRENELRLRGLFGELGWECRFDYPGLSQSMTPWGPVAFQDGVQSWLNPALSSASA